MAEFIGMTIFQIYGGNAPNSVAAFGNGITLVVLGEDRTMQAHTHCAELMPGVLLGSAFCR